MSTVSRVLSKLPNGKYDAIIFGVAHKDFKNLDIETLKASNSIVYDVKGVFENVDERL